MIRKLTTILASAVFALLPIATLAQLTPGTTLTGNIDQNLSSNHAYVGQRVTISNAHSPNNDINGATVWGHVSSVQPAGQGTPGKITLSFDKVQTRSGSVYAVNGYATDVSVQTKNNTVKEVGGAAAGALVGGLLFHGVGALIGAGGGALLAKNNRQNVNIPQGSSVSLRVVRARRQSAG
ncbi:MAG: hypothetical protein ABSH03_07125 [Candidatus Lustribacter sp.]|jgi:hypothetical protein